MANVYVSVLAAVQPDSSGPTGRQLLRSLLTESDTDGRLRAD